MREIQTQREASEDSSKFTMNPVMVVKSKYTTLDPAEQKSAAKERAQTAAPETAKPPESARLKQNLELLVQKQIQRRQENEKARKLKGEIERFRVLENLKKLEYDI